MEPRPRPGRGRLSRSSHLRRTPAQRVPPTRRQANGLRPLLLQRGCLPDAAFGKFSSCPRIWQKRSAFRMMEGYRSKTGRSLTVVSGCRCPSRNAAIGGSPTSRHLKGLACDVEAEFSVPKVKSWRVATHISRLWVLQPEGQAHRQGLSCNRRQSARLRRRKLMSGRGAGPAGGRREYALDRVPSHPQSAVWSGRLPGLPIDRPDVTPRAASALFATRCRWSRLGPLVASRYCGCRIPGWCVSVHYFTSGLGWT